MFSSRLYHTKRYKGTTTQTERDQRHAKLYHTKRYKGTTTLGADQCRGFDYIIPKDIRELRPPSRRNGPQAIISYQKI